MSVGLGQILIASAILFAAGAFGLLARRSVIAVLIATQLIVVAGSIAFVAFAHFGRSAQTPGAGSSVALFATLAGLVQLGLGAAMGLLLYRESQSLTLDPDRG
jgi:NADH-quinone oxidoreductase subunit K